MKTRRFPSPEELPPPRQNSVCAPHVWAARNENHIVAFALDIGGGWQDAGPGHEETLPAHHRAPVHQGWFQLFWGFWELLSSVAALVKDTLNTGIRFVLVRRLRAGCVSLALTRLLGTLVTLKIKNTRKAWSGNVKTFRSRSYPELFPFPLVPAVNFVPCHRWVLVCVARW